MMPGFSGIIVAIVLLLATRSISMSVEVRSGVTLTGGYIGNLFYDSSHMADSYTALYPQVRIYPSLETEIEILGSYTSYQNTTELNRHHARASFSVIPTPASSPLGLLVTAHMEYQGYGRLYDQYNTAALGMSVACTYRLGGLTSLRGAILYDRADYTNAVGGDFHRIEASAGVNLVMLQDNSIDLETGFLHSRFRSMNHR